MGKNAELKRSILDFLKKELASQGFRRSDRSFYRKIPIGRQILQLFFLRGEDGIFVDQHVSIRHNEIQILHNLLTNVKPNDRTATIGVGLGRLANIRSFMWPIARESDVPVVGKVDERDCSRLFCNTTVERRNTANVKPRLNKSSLLPIHVFFFERICINDLDNQTE